MGATAHFPTGICRQSMKQWLSYSLILALSSYAAVDIFCFHNTIHYNCDSASESLAPLKSSATKDPGACARRDGHYDTTSSRHVEQNPWNQMKWVGEAAACRVKGHLIEKLDDLNDFRRGFALQFTADVEDRTHLFPWFLASKTSDLAERQRRVYIDLGAKSFNSSVEWFLRMYPLEFTEVHAFEVNGWQWHPPHTHFEEAANYVATGGGKPIRVKSTPSIPNWMMERVKVYYRLVSEMDDPSKNAIDISRFIKEELRLTADDTVVVKMDIEGAEWPILRRWMEDPLMPRIIDELFVEVHYASPTMSNYGWNMFRDHSREDAARLLADLRWRGFYAHFWP